MVNVDITNQASQTFTFADGEVNSVSSRTTATPDADPMPMSSPGQALIFDFNGALKTITVTGILFETTVSRVSGGTVQTIAQQKRWLETLLDGSQLSVQFNSNYEKYTFAGDGSNVGHVDSFVAGTGTQTKVVVTDITFEEREGSPNDMPFTMRMVAGS